MEARLPVRTVESPSAVQGDHPLSEILPTRSNPGYDVARPSAALDERQDQKHAHRQVLERVGEPGRVEDVKSYRSELGVLYLSNFNKRVISKALSDAGLEFVALFEAEPHVFVGEHHPLAQETSVKPEQLEDYTRYSFEQGANNSFFFSEEPLSHLPHKKQITYSDRGTLSNLLTNFDGYTIATGVLSDEMNAGIVAIPLEADEKMTVGYIHQAAHDLSELAKRYIKKLRAYIEANPTVTTYIEHPNAAGDEN